MIHLLIDTCSYRNLIRNKFFSRDISELENKINSGEIKLYTHQNIINEWQKHKNKWLKDIERTNNYSNRYNENNENLPTIYDGNNKFLLEQFSKIDHILKCAVCIETPKVILDETHIRSKNRLAPFHNNLQSWNDWEIIGSIANYCENNGIKALHFISSNSNDFGSANKEKDVLHESLIERFKHICIKYIENISDFFYNYLDTLVIDANTQFFKILPSSKFSYESSLNNNVLDALDVIFNNNYKELGFIPTRILKKLYPFTKDKDSKVYNDLFRLSNINEELVYFFKNVKMQKNGKINFSNLSEISKIKDYENKTREALRNLRRNLIYNLNNKDYREDVEIVFHTPIKCNCYKCQYKDFNFFGAIEKLSSEIVSEDNKENLCKAYYHYRLGNLYTAIEIYKKIIPSALNKKEFFIYTIANYNLKNIAPLLRNFFRNHSINYQLADELQEIDLFQIAYQVKAFSDYNFIQFLVDDRYFTYAFENISDKSKEIIEHFHFQQRGGWSSNNKVWSLIEEYAILQQFISENHIICDVYSDYESLFDMALEGLFASYALDADQGGRLCCIDNYWIEKIIFYAKKESIIKYIKRYGIKSFKLSENQNGNKYILNVANKLFKHYNREKINKVTDENNNFLHRHISSLFDSFLTFCTYLDIDEVTTEKLSKKILVFLKKENILGWDNIECVLSFILNKQKQISFDTLLGYLNYFQFKNKGHSVDNIEKLLNCFPRKSLDKLSNDTFNLIISQCLSNCKFCNQKHDIDILISLFNRVGEERKKIITLKIDESLKTKFSFELYYIANIYGILNSDKEILKNHLDGFQPPEKNHSFKSVFSGIEDLVIPYLNQLLNLAFKENYKISPITIIKLKNINNYYNWLLDLDGFNYDDFDINWIANYQTCYYFNHFKKSERLHNYLIDFVKKNPENIKIAKILFKLEYEY